MKTYKFKEPRSPAEEKEVYVLREDRGDRGLFSPADTRGFSIIPTDVFPMNDMVEVQ